MFERKKQLGRDKVSNLINWGHWFAFINGLLAMMVGWSYIASIGEPETFISVAYLSLYTLGQFTFLAFIVYLVFIFPITIFLPYSRILRGFAAVIATLGLCTLIYDTIVFEDYGLHLSPFAFELAWGDISSLVQSTSYLAIPIAILIFQLTLSNFLWKRIVKIQRKNYGPKVLFVVGAAFISSHLIHIWADATNYIDITRYDDAYPVSYPATAKTFMESHGFERPTQVKRPQGEKVLSYPMSPLQCQANSTPNILMIAVKSLRSDVVNNETMPFLSQYAQKNISFNNHLTGGTQFNSSMFSLLYSLQTSYMDNAAFNYTSPIFTRELKKKGYNLEFFSTKTQLNYTQPKAMFADFEKTFARPHANSTVSDLDKIESFQKWQHHQSKPWFSVITLDSTSTYDTPVGFLGIKTIKTPKDYSPAQRVLFNQYRQSAYFVDKQIEMLVESLPKNTLVVIAGINGNVLKINDNNYKDLLSPDNVNVPLIMHLPNSGSKVINYRTSHYDFVPTMLTQVFGCTNPVSDYSSGSTLLSPSDYNWVYVGDQRIFAIYQKNETTVIDRHGKYRIYDPEFKYRLKKKMSAPELIQVMREGRRLYNN
ncbi:DUF3413 domain-containing protein [Parashewanella curva]|uniref:DUF3413 domain-containing protein n=1 Tax=Parashewanella curva TaxID=2338552 RepID=A0A3L8Q0T6_9GAMM|nr:DUF3413 domain-containing protein [Parashewanella curva]RLV60669.1 DUF3413 domain-containing protein [Parashewanella curva]